MDRLLDELPGVDLRIIADPRQRDGPVAESDPD
jgi:hypothetical protein